MITPATTHAEDTSGQKDLIGVLSNALNIHIKKKKGIKGQKVYYSLLPIGTSVPGGGTALVTTTQAGFYTGDRKTTYISTITFSPSTNFKGQFNLPFRSNIWSPNNKWNFQGDMRYSYFPQNNWGLGGRQPEDDKVLINYSYVRFYFSALKRIKPYIFAGIGYNLDYHIAIQPKNDSIDLQQFTGYKYGTVNNSNSFSSGIAFNLLYDARVNSINPLPGFYYNIIYRVNPKFLGSDDFWNSIYVDVRKYIPFSRKDQNVLAIWTYLWTTLGSHSPYLSLPATGWDTNQRSGRGFYNRRYTGKTLWYLETEYRKQLSANGLFGFVVFANLNSVTEPDKRQFAYLHPAAGAGLRIKFNKNSGTNIGLDYGVSKGFKAIYISLGEAF
ncbi:MAG: BamA/TamA family outer membrane protein [Chitinophagaceae bacterium]